MDGFRLIPATIVIAALLLCVKVIGMVRDTEALFIAPVEAQQGDKPSNVSSEKPDVVPDQEAPAKKSEDNKTQEKTPEQPEKQTKNDEKKADVGAAKDVASDDAKKEKSADKEKNNASKDAVETTERRYTAVEVELLQSLSKRREELDRWEQNIQIKEAALEAAQKRIDEKAEQIEAMKKQVSELLAKYNSQEDAKIKSLVKIYENMKPVDAARIFDEVEMPILLLVIDSMAEKKASPILAAMNPKKAKQLTVELANERRLNSGKINGAIGTGSADAVSAPAQAKP